MPDSRIEYLISCFHSKNISPLEKDELMQLLAEKENQQAAELFFGQAWEQFEPGQPLFTNERSKAILKKILEANQSGQTVVVKRFGNRIRWGRYAAAAIVIITIGYGIYMNKGVAPKEPVVSTVQISPPDLAPGGNRAVLTLSDQTRIYLDDAANGTLANQGNISVKKTKNGQLIYEIVNNTPSALNNGTPAINTITTPKGGQYAVVLPDGTKVWLNASSSLTFPAYFSGHERRVELTGEGYFEVARNKDMPFYVKSGNTNVEVLGTHFNINAYGDEQFNRTTLLEGSVKISNSRTSTIIKPGQQAMLNNETLAINVVKTDAEEAIAWKNGYFMFVDEDIHSIMRKLSRWYGADVHFMDPDINEKFGGTISKFKNISEVLELLEVTGTIHFKIMPGDASGKGRRIIVMK